MEDFFHVTIAILFGLVGLYIIISRILLSRQKGPLPPGPKGLPIVGNINDMPKPGVVEAYHWLKHKDLYGPLSSVTTFGQTIVLINDAELATELLTNRAPIHSSRPRLLFAGEIVGWAGSTALSPNTHRWRKLRKNIAKVVTSSSAVKVFNKVQDAESAHFLLDILKTPQDLYDHIRKEAAAVVAITIYGYTPEPYGTDPLVELAGRAGHTFQDATVPGRWLVDTLPFLRYLPNGLPGTAFKSTGKAMRDVLTQCIEQPNAFVRQQMREKRHKTSFLSEAFETIGTGVDEELVHKWAANSLFTGGSDTTVSSLQSFFLAMMLFPEVQIKAREEIDRVIGCERLPVSTDRDKLPYLVATMKEAHRWHPVAPMGIAHASTAEDTCNGYLIPKGATLLANVWWFTHDPAVYPDPMTFRPERFIETPTHSPERDPRDFIFGFGRRVCPGRYVADNAVFVTIAQSLAVFDISKPVDQAGNVIEPVVEFEPGTASHPVPYTADIRPRSEKHEALIRKSEEVYPWDPSDAKEFENVKWQ